MVDFKLKLVLTVLSSVLLSMIFIMLALILPTPSSNYDGDAFEKKPQTQFNQMSKSMRDGFKK